VDLIVNLPLPACVKDIHFFGYVDFYLGVVKDFRKTAISLPSLLAREVILHFSKEREVVFIKPLTTTPILYTHIWEEQFELMCDASDYALALVLNS